MNDRPALESRRVRTQPSMVMRLPTGSLPASTAAMRVDMGLAFGVLAADDGQVHADLHRHRLAVDRDHRLAVHVPAEAAGGELLDLGEHLLAVDDHLHRLGLLEELRERYGTGGLGRHDPRI